MGFCSSEILFDWFLGWFHMKVYALYMLYMIRNIGYVSIIVCCPYMVTHGFSCGILKVSLLGI